MVKDSEQHPDKTPVFGLDEVEPQVTGSENAVATKTDPPQDVEISLHDALSGARLTSKEPIVEIGNGRRFDLALRGPGPDGLYARLEQDRKNGVCTIEKAQDGLFMAVDTVETDQAVLTDNATIQLGDHTLHFSLIETRADSNPKKRPAKWIALAVVLVVATSVFGLKFLLSADEADSRVTVVEPDQAPNQETAPQIPENPEPQAQPQSAPKSEALPDSSPDPAKKPQPPKQESVASNEPEALTRIVQTSPPAPASADQQAEPQAPAPEPEQKPDQGNRNTLAEGNEDSTPETPDSDPQASSAALQARAASARAAGDLHMAYSLYARAAELGKQIPEGRQFMAKMDQQAERLYRFGYRLKYSDPETASDYWRRVIDSAPPQSQWYQKANLALNDTTGAQNDRIQ
ncbi:hypothetical protein [Marinobacter confluentis]|uniref:Uncharacterized protein n=1 Tax=Marinobacter confluentis TaxID=1697557 RepID=A0A4Z1C3Q8_9GAMM|nr:hypothetical protein [Marinobacter confluentis]TGN41868.1 hypothetical protein E5Q11_04940 [Marinobacter confluentis]